MRKSLLRTCLTLSVGFACAIVVCISSIMGAASFVKPTASATLTPTVTYTPSLTFTPSATFTPSDTATNTLMPSIIPTLSHTDIAQTQASVHTMTVQAQIDARTATMQSRSENATLDAQIRFITATSRAADAEALRQYYITNPIQITWTPIPTVQPGSDVQLTIAPLSDGSGQPIAAPPSGNGSSSSSAVCNDGTTWSGGDHRGACSHHKGVNHWTS